MEKKVRKQNALPLKRKIELLQAVDAGGRSKTVISKEFGIPNSTLSTILKNRDKLTEMFEHSKYEPDRKRFRGAKHEDLEAALLMWFKQARSQNAQMSGPLLKAKANAFAVEMGIEFSSNPGWLERFKKRHGIVFSNVSGGAGGGGGTGESHQVSEDMTAVWLKSILPNLLQDYDAKDIFNAVETAIYYRCLPDKTLSFKGEQCCDGKKSKERITVMVACNSDGSEKLPLFVIGKSLNPRCFKDVKKLPVEYTANKVAWMTEKLFIDWLVALDKRFTWQNRKIAMIVDKCPAHSDVHNLTAIKLIFLPPNTTKILKPCDQGIIQNLKFFYRKLLLRKYLAAVEAKEEFVLNILDALHMLRAAWSSVTSKTIESCFHHAGFSTLSTPAEVPVVDIEMEPTMDEMFGRVASLMNISVSLNDYVAVDDDVSTAPILSDSDIVNVVRPTIGLGDDDSDDDPTSDKNNEELTIPSASNVRLMLKSLRRYLDCNSNGEMYQTIDDLEEFVDNKLITNTMLSKITDFF